MQVEMFPKVGVAKSTSMTFLGSTLPTGTDTNQKQAAGSYYVDFTNGNDANDGLSPATAWKTKQKVNDALLLPGNVVRFKRGETWDGQTTLNLSQNGNAGNPILISDYGAGALPRITYETSRAVYLSGSYITFENIFVGENNVGAQGIVIAGHHITVQDCEVTACSDIGILGWGHSAECHDLTIQRNLVYGITAGSGIVIESHDWTDGPTGVLIAGNTCRDNGADIYSDHGIYVAINGGIVRNNTCYDNAGAGIKNNSSVDTVFDSNVCYGTSLNAQHYGFVDGYESGALNQNNFYYNNKIWLCGYGFYIIAVTAGNGYYHNTVVDCSKGITGTGSLFMGGSVSGCDIRNNIFIQRASVVNAAALVYVPSALAEISANEFNYNDVYAETTNVTKVNGTGELYNWTQWRAAGKDLNSTNADPSLLAYYTDFHIPSNSSARDAGQSGIGVSYDFDDIARIDPPDCGCLEYHA